MVGPHARVTSAKSLPFQSLCKVAERRNRTSSGKAAELWRFAVFGGWGNGAWGDCSSDSCLNTSGKSISVELPKVVLQQLNRLYILLHELPLLL